MVLQLPQKAHEYMKWCSRWFKVLASFISAIQFQLLGVVGGNRRHAVNYNEYPGKDGQVLVACI